MVKEVRMPQLATYELKPYFYIDSNTKGAVFFSAPVGGATTPNSNNPRSELRQMNGDDNAAWSNASATFNMEAVMAFHEIPTDSDPTRGTVGMQVHDGNDDVTVLRLEKNGDLWLTKGDTAHGRLANGNYVMDTFMKVRIEARRGGGFYWYINDTLIGPGPVVSGVKSGCYFKAGAYAQIGPNSTGRGSTFFRSLRIWKS